MTAKEIKKHYDLRYVSEEAAMEINNLWCKSKIESHDEFLSYYGRAIREMIKSYHKIEKNRAKTPTLLIYNYIQ